MSGLNYPVDLEYPERSLIYTRITFEPPPLASWDGSGWSGYAASENDFFWRITPGSWTSSNFWWSHEPGEEFETGVRVDFHDDPHDEPDESFSMELGVVVYNETWTDVVDCYLLPPVLVTIVDDDLRVPVSLGSATVNEAAGVVEVPVTVLVPPHWGQRLNQNGENVGQVGESMFQVWYQIDEGSAHEEDDYELPADYDATLRLGELILTPETPNGVIQIPIVDDSLTEGLESFSVTLIGGIATTLRSYGYSTSRTDDGGSSPLTLVIPTAEITIVDDEGLPTSGTGTGGTGTGGTGTGGTGTGGTGTGGTGTGGTDGGGTGTGGTGTGGTGTGGTGDGGTGDGGTGDGGTGDGGTGDGGTGDGGTGDGGTGDGGTGTGGGSGPPPSTSATISITSASAMEGLGSIMFGIVIGNPSTDAITLNYSTSDLSATDAIDYVGASGSIVIPPNATSSSLAISLNDDSDNEGDEDFEVNFSLASGSSATLSNSSVVGTILNDDGSTSGGGGGGLPSVNLSDISIYEDDAGGYVTICGSLSSASTSDVTVQVMTVDGTATAGSDYTGFGPNTWMIPAYSTSFSFTVPITNDAIAEPTETFDVVFSSPTGATLGDGTATVTIFDDEPIAVIGGPVTGGEGTTNGNKVTFTLDLIQGGMSFPLIFPAASVTVNYTITFESGDTASAADFGTLSGSHTFTPSSSTGPRLVYIDIPVTDDTLVEGTETFTISITSATGAHVSTTSSSTTGTIADDDSSSGRDLSLTFSIAVDLDRDGGPDVYDPAEDEIIVPLNDDDDNSNSTPDVDDTGFVAAEDDLVAVSITVTSDRPLDGRKLFAYGLGVQFWRDAQKTNAVTSDDPYVISGTGGSSSTTVTLWVEGIALGATNLTFEVTPDSSGTVGSSNNGATTFGGLVTKIGQAIWISLLYQAKSVHSKYLYYEPSGLKSLFRSMFDRTKGLDFLPNLLNPTAVAEYVMALDTIRANNLGSTPLPTVIHETVHAIDRVNGWNLSASGIVTTKTQAEAFAYAVEAIHENTRRLREFEDKARNGTLTIANVETNWLPVLGEVNSILDTPVYVDNVQPPVVGGGLRKVNSSDLFFVEEKLGVRLDFSVLMPMYQALLDERGIAYTLSMDVGAVQLKSPFRGD